MRRLILPLLFAIASAGVSAADNGKATGAKPSASTKNYDYYLSGSAADVQPPAPPTPFWLLMGGGNDVDAGFRAMIAKARGGAGSATVDVVVIRASGADGYNPYLMAMDGVDSVETLVIKNRTGADDATVNAIVGRADLVFIAGGDQSVYVSQWKGSRLDATLQQLRARFVPLGGTSAGLAVLGDVDYTGASGSITSAEALTNPYDRKLTLDRGFITGLQGLGGAITDSHLFARDRMGRLVTFLARMIKDGLAPLGSARGIGIDEATALAVDNGQAEVLGAGHAYFLLPLAAPTTIAARKPLEFASVRVERLAAGGGRFDLLGWNSGTQQISPYFLGAAGGQLSSSQLGGGIY